MLKEFGYKTTVTKKALEMQDYIVWDGSVLKSNGKYHLFCSRWPKEYGFGWNWLFRSEVVHCVADDPQGPYEFCNVILPARGRQYFDGMNTHNPCIREYNGKFYLYYMGTSYHYPTPGAAAYQDPMMALEVWNSKRIGLAVADSIDGPFIRRDEPLLLPRDHSHWDCTITTNPAVAILPDGTTYMIYKSRAYCNAPLQIGIARADKPDGPFERLSNEPILTFEDPNSFVEDPFLWYDAARKKFCLLAKDDCRNGCTGITGEFGNGFYAESDDCVHFTIAENPIAYTRNCLWEDGRRTKPANMERVSLLFDENSAPEYAFFATGDADRSYGFDATYIACTKLEKK